MANRNAPTYRWFGMILYPDNLDHMKCLEFIKTNALLFPSYLYIRHLPEDWLEKADPDIKVDEVDLAAEDLLTRGDNKAHYHVCVKSSRAVSEDSMQRNFVFKDETGKRINMVSITPHLAYPEKYFTYILHWDMDSVMKGKHKYDISELHGDNKIIGKLGAQNLYFVQKGDDLINKWIISHPGAALVEFRVWVNSLHNKDPSSYLAVTQAMREPYNMIASSIKDWKFNKRDYIEAPEAFFDGNMIEISPEETELIFERKQKRK